MKIKLLAILILICAAQMTPGYASDVNNGRKIYQQNCAICHGENGNSTMANAANFKRGEGLFQSDLSLLRRIQNGKRACPAYRGILTEQKIFDVIAYIRTLYP